VLLPVITLGEIVLFRLWLVSWMGSAQWSLSFIAASNCCTAF
jgi:hypothetical protein